MTQEKSIQKKKEMKLNINYISFIKKLAQSKIEVTEKNRKSIEDLYLAEVGLKFTNVPRVSHRTQRDKLKKLFEEKLKEADLSKKVFEELDQKVVAVSKQRSSNYLSA